MTLRSSFSPVGALLVLAGLSSAPALADTPLTAEALAGRWGLAAYFREADAGRVEQMARAHCGQPYTIARGRQGGVMMHLPDEAAASELAIKTSVFGGKVHIGPAGDEAGGKKDREVLRYDGRVLVLRWTEASVANRYGTMVFVRCGGR